MVVVFRELQPITGAERITSDRIHATRETYSFIMPVEVAQEEQRKKVLRVRARYQDGVLTVKLPSPNNVSNPHVARLAPFAAMKASATTTISTSPLPVDLNLTKAGVHHGISNLGDAPHPPIVGEGSFANTPVFRLVVEAETGAVADRVKVLLLKVIREPWKTSNIKGWFTVLRATEGINHHETVTMKSLAAGLKIAQKGGAGVESEVAKIESSDDIGLGRRAGKHVSLQSENSVAGRLVELGKIVLFSVLQRLRIDIKADCLLGGIELNPFAAHGEGSTEIFPERGRFSTV